MVVTMRRAPSPTIPFEQKSISHRVLSSSSGISARPIHWLRQERQQEPAFEWDICLAKNARQTPTSSFPVSRFGVVAAAGWLLDGRLRSEKFPVSGPVRNHYVRVETFIRPPEPDTSFRGRIKLGIGPET